MNFLVASAVLLLAHVALADREVIINDDVDKSYAEFRKFLTGKGLGVFDIAPFMLNGVEMRGGVLVGLNSLNRTGDCTMRSDDAGTRVTLDLHVGLGLLDIAFPRISLDGEEMSGVFRVRENSFHVKYTVFRYGRPGCKLSLDTNEVERLDRVTLDASLASHYGQDVSDLFANTVRKELNQQADKAKSRIEKALETLVCANSHNDFSQLPKVLTALLQS